MEKAVLYRELAAALGKYTRAGRVLMCRGSADRDYLHEWAYAPVNPPLSGSIDGIRAMIESCNRCGQGGEKKFGFGTGVNGVMVLLNSPRALTGMEVQLYKNESAQLLKKMISATGLSFDECYITNLLKCEPSESIIEPSRALANCGHILEHELETVNPAVAIVMGDIIPVQRIMKEVSGVTWYNIEHPITLIKNPELKRPAWNTLKVVMEKLKELGRN